MANRCNMCGHDCSIYPFLGPWCQFVNKKDSFSQIESNWTLDSGVMSYVYSVHHALGELRIVLLSYKDRKGANLNQCILSDPDLVFEVLWADCSELHLILEAGKSPLCCQHLHEDCSWWWPSVLLTCVRTSFVLNFVPNPTPNNLAGIFSTTTVHKIHILVFHCTAFLLLFNVNVPDRHLWPDTIVWCLMDQGSLTD